VSLASSIVDAIKTQEGYYPGSRAYRNNNPGNIWDDVIPGVKPRRIWPQYPIDNGGFLVLPDYQTGYNLAVGQINLKISRGESLTQAINEWDSGDPASTRATYVANVSAALGIDPNVPLNTLGDTSPPNPPTPLPTHSDKG